MMPTISGERPSRATAGSADRLVTAAANSATNSTPFNWPRSDDAAACDRVGAVVLMGRLPAFDGMRQS
ncbi:hypothetical protein ACOTW7_21610 [Burkholderia glumae]